MYFHPSFCQEGVHSIKKLELYLFYQINNEKENLQEAYTQGLNYMLYSKMLRAIRDIK